MSQEQENTERKIRETQRAAFYGWVRFVVTLATALLGVSVSFQKAYVPAQPVHLGTLKWCWICLFVTIVAGVFRASGDFSEYQKFLNYKPTSNIPLAAPPPERTPPIGPGRLLFCSFYVMLAAFLAALVLLVIFANENVRP